MKKYFENVDCLEELKKQYKKLAKKYHPDINPDGSEDMKAVNNEYERLFKQYKNIHKNSEGEKYEKETTETPEMFRNIIDNIINFNIDIEVIGTWVWCFNSFEYRKQLKELGFKYAAKKQAWVWHSEETKCRRSKLSIEEIRAKYGSDTIKRKKEQEKLA